MKCRYNNSPLFYNFIVDYRTSAGVEMYGVWQMPTCSAKDEREAAEYLNEFLKQQRLYPYQIVSIRGNYSPQKLFDMAQGKGNIKGSKVKVIEADFL